MGASLGGFTDRHIATGIPGQKCQGLAIHTRDIADIYVGLDYLQGLLFRWGCHGH